MRLQAESHMPERVGFKNGMLTDTHVLEEEGRTSTGLPVPWKWCEEITATWPQLQPQMWQLPTGGKLHPTYHGLVHTRAGSLPRMVESRSWNRKRGAVGGVRTTQRCGGDTYVLGGTGRGRR